MIKTKKKILTRSKITLAIPIQQTFLCMNYRNKKIKNCTIFIVLQPV